MPTTTGTATELITFSRGSLATVTDSNGYIKWAPHNLLLASEQFDASSWVKDQGTVSLPVVTANAGVAPNGTNTADRVDFGAIDDASDYTLVNQRFTSVDATYTTGAWMKAATAGDVGKKIALSLWDIAAVGRLYVTLTSEWQYVTTSGSLTAGIERRVDFLVAGSTYGGENQGAVSVYLWGAHLYRSDLGGMQANASAYPYYNPSTPKNLLGYSEAFSNAAWQLLADGGGGAPTKGTVTGTFPTGSAGTVNTITFPVVTSAQTSAIYQTLGAAYLNTPITFSVYARVSSGTGTIYLNVEDNAAAPAGGNFFASAAKTLTTEWQRISVTGTRTSNTGNVSLVIGFDTRCSAGQTNASSVIVELWGAQLSDSASLDPYVGSYGAAPSPAAAYGPRLDYDPSTLAAKGLLVEEQRTNLTTASETFTTGWTSLNATISNNVAISPAGTNTASKLVTANSTTFQGRYVLASYTNGTTYTVSAYVKAAEITRFSFQSANLGQAPTATFNLSTGTVVSTGAGSTATMTAVGNGWYRVTATRTSTATDVEYLVIYCINSADSNNFAGNGSDGIFVWGYQLEAEAFATSYIPTAAATVTRNADVAFVATSQFPYSASEGTIVVAWSMIASKTQTGYPAAVQLDAGSGTAYIAIRQDGTGDARRYGIVETPTTAAAMLNLTAETLTANTVLKAGLAFKQDDFAFTRGSTLATNSSGLVPGSLTTMRLGRNEANIYVNCHIRQITYIPRRLTNAELIARST